MPDTPELIDAATAIEIFRKTYPRGGAIAEVEHIPRGFSHDVWLVRAAAGQYSLHVSLVHASPERLHNAIAAHRLISGARVPVPKILAWNDGTLLGRPLHVQEWIPGQDAEVAWPALSPPTRVSIAHGFGRALSRVHAIPGPHVGNVTYTKIAPSWSGELRAYLARNANRLRRLGLLSPAMLKEVVVRLESGIAGLTSTIQPALTH